MQRLIVGLLLVCSSPLFAATEPPPWTVDFRYAPPVWQTSICLPDDWQKTLAGQDGSLLYDYPGRYSGFATRITFGTAEQSQVLQQWLQAPAVPIVHTVKQAGPVRIDEDAFAVAPARHAQSAEIHGTIERLGTVGQQEHWANPPSGTSPVFRSVDVGWSQPLRYRTKVPAGAAVTAVFGLCEGWHTNAAERVLVLETEGGTARTIDPISARGRNRPMAIALDARDANRDGWIEMTVRAAEGSPDSNAILNALWVFDPDRVPAEGELVLSHSTRAPRAFLDCGAGGTVGTGPRQDVIRARLANTGTDSIRITPTLTIDSEQGIRQGADRQRIVVGGNTTIFLPQPYQRVIADGNRWVVEFLPVDMAPRSEHVAAVGVLRGPGAEALPRTAAEAEALHQRATRFWEKLDLPYDTLQVPDAGIQSLLTSSVRNIYQAREVKKGLPAFQVGPTCYRGLWVVDGSFILEAVTYAGREKEARSGVHYLLGFQREDGAFMLIDGHWKETGIALWAVSRHAKLTGDREWLRSVWPQVCRGFEFIRRMRTMAAADSPNAGLVPDGFSDGGLPDRVPEYTNIYWTLAGLKAAVEAARWLGEDATAELWEHEYADFFAAFRKAAARDMKTDPSGNRYLPIRMARGEGIAPQKAQWAFCHAVFPGGLFAADDPMVQGNMAMLRATEAEEMVFDTGWLKNGIWNYFGSFYAHAWLWLGDGAKAAQTLYAFANHASPLLVWREEHMPVGRGDGFVGDMPHNWASAEFIRLVRHSLVLERGTELHLLEGIPPTWFKAGDRTRVRQLTTEFGPMSMDVEVAADGRSATVRVEPPRRDRPSRIVLHVGDWGATPGPLDVSRTKSERQTILLRERKGP
jgi:hypothetical protein